MDNSIKYINLNELIPGEFQPHIEETKTSLENLTNSIKNNGIIIPLIVRPKGIQYEIILGNRRYNAARILRIEKIPVIILDIDDAKAINLIISDNVQRKELTGKEEGYLYEKAIEYQNITKEKLNINLGIPLDRIEAKLNLVKEERKKEPPKLFDNQNDVSTSSMPNFINNDIINLSELDKKERNEFNMNNNQFVNNNQINTNNQQQSTLEQNMSQSEPAFGRRFFPSLEDEPTNMNLNTGIGNINIPNNITSQPSNNNIDPTPASFIDLTDTSHEEPINLTQNIQTPINSQTSSINMPNVQTSFNNQSPINEMPSQSINQGQDINYKLNQMSPIPNNLDTSQNQQTPQGQFINQSLDIQSPQNIQPNLINQQPQESVQSMNTNNLTPTYNEINNTISDYSIPPIEPQNINNQPQVNELNTNNIENSQDTDQTTDDLDSENIPDDSTLSQETEHKNVIPIVNMIKDLAINIEALGYNIEITEDDNQENYKITIEVEK